MLCSSANTSHRPTVTMTATTALLVFAAAAVLCLGGIIARHNLRGDINITSSSPLRSKITYELLDTTGPLARLNNNAAKKTAAWSSSSNNTYDDEYFVFLQKFPLQNTWQMIFHTEVVVCQKNTFDSDFVSTLQQLAQKLSSSSTDNKNDSSKVLLPFVQVPEEQWNKQSNAKCVQLGYGGADCPSVCCGSPHGHENTNYALNSRRAVIGNAMGEAKQLFLYGVSDSISGVDAHRAVCREQGDENNKIIWPTCVSQWAGTDYNPITNNCNTFTSTVLKCVYGLSDKKPGLGISDMVNVECPMEKKDDGSDVRQCLIPTTVTTGFIDDVDGLGMKKEE